MLMERCFQISWSYRGTLVVPQRRPCDLLDLPLRPTGPNLDETVVVEAQGEDGQSRLIILLALHGILCALCLAILMDCMLDAMKKIGEKRGFGVVATMYWRSHRAVEIRDSRRRRG